MKNKRMEMGLVGIAIVVAFDKSVTLLILVFGIIIKVYYPYLKRKVDQTQDTINLSNEINRKFQLT